ncbi:MAG TPA: serine/threonine-protein kinase, partial [Planctomycetota bacterium]|nr:serine/threonine-protein kinase [Planctomycetota bacterium]
MSESRIPKIAKYELTQRVGQRLLGPVFKGRHVQLSMDVGLQVLAPELMKKFPAMQERFLADARAAGRVEHPNVARVIDCGVDNQLHFVATQWAAGETLSERLQGEGSMEPLAALEMARDVAKGLAAAQLEGLYHRDLRPEKIVLNAGQPAKVQEIGVTPLSEPEVDAAVAAGGPRPTAHYTAPEICVDPSKFDHRADIYSLGAVLFHALAGVRPFEGTSAFDLMRKITDQPPVDLKKEKPFLTEGVVNLVLRMMAKEPGKRFATYAALGEALEAQLKVLADGPGLVDATWKTDSGAIAGGGAAGSAEAGSSGDAAGDLPAAQDLTEAGGGGAPADGTAPGGRRKGATTKQNPTGTRRGATTKKADMVTGTRRQTGAISGTGRQGAVRTGTNRQEPVAAAASNKMPLLIVGGVVLLAVIGAVLAVVLMDNGGKPPPKISGPEDPVPGGGPNPPPVNLPPPVVVDDAKEKQY